MKKSLAWSIVLFFSILMSGCKPLSIGIKGDDCRMNGSFEILKDGLPVNWNYYAPETVPQSDFTIVSDTLKCKDGKRSLQFIINNCKSTGGSFSPGFFKEFKVLPGETYTVSFYAINNGCILKVRAETGMKGNSGISETIVEKQESFSDWKHYEHMIQIPSANDNLRFEVNILSPGTIWFDDIRITGVNDKGERYIYPYKGDEECK